MKDKPEHLKHLIIQVRVHAEKVKRVGADEEKGKHSYSKVHS